MLLTSLLAATHLTKTLVTCTVAFLPKFGHWPEHGAARTCLARGFLGIHFGRGALVEAAAPLVLVFLILLLAEVETAMFVGVVPESVSVGRR